MTAGTLATPAAAAPFPSKPTFDINNVAYSQDMRAGAIETFANIPRDLPQNIGYSHVRLVKDIQEASPRCIADGGGYWPGDILEERVLKGGVRGSVRARSRPMQARTTTR